MRDIHTVEELESLPVGQHIDDQGLHAVKVKSGAWLYDDGHYWEPQFFPVRAL